VGEGMKFKLYV